MRKRFMPEPVLAFGGFWIMPLILSTFSFVIKNVLFCFIDGNYGEACGWLFLVIFPLTPGFLMFDYGTTRRLTITDKYIKFHVLLFPSVKIKWEDVKVIDIVVFKEGNDYYYQDCRVDAYNYLVVSASPLPRLRIDKIHPSRRKKIIKFPMNKRICKTILELEQIDDKYKGNFKYLMHRYKQNIKL